jgi:hypothetical protein
MTLDKEPAQLRQHVLATYFGLRTGIAVVGIALPLVLWIVGYFYAHLCLQRSISAYYHAVGPTYHSMRNWFVGSLFVVGTFLYLYKGFSKLENILLNIGGVLAVLVALVPMRWQPCDLVVCGITPGLCKGPGWSPHGISAVGFFLCIVLVIFCCSNDTLPLIKDVGFPKADELIARYKRIYRTIAVLMVASIAAAYILNVVGSSHSTVFWVEVAGIWSFAAYWLVKSHEMSKTEAEARAMCGELTRRDGKVRRMAALEQEEGRDTESRPRSIT